MKLSKMGLLLTAAVTSVGLSFTAAMGKVVTYDIDISEDQVKNGPEGDGSTNSTATGTARVELDTTGQQISIQVVWSGLLGDLTKLHIHGPATPAVSNGQHLVEYINSNADVLQAITDGNIVEDPAGTFTFTDNNRPIVTIPDHDDPGVAPDFEPAQIVDIITSGQSYFNVHTTSFPMGEIRGNIIPEPSTLGLLVTVGFMAGTRRKRSRAEA